MRKVLNHTTLRRVVALFRDHRFGQILNTLQFRYHALRGFRKARLPYSPVWLTLFITSRCNLRCRQCPYRSPSTPRESLLFHDMTLDAFREILDRFPRTTGITFTGGEPLLHPELFEMISLAHERRMEVRITTNGTLLARKIDAFLAAPVDVLNVSLYGADAGSFAELTGGQASLFGEITAAIAELASRRPPGGYPRILQTSFICTKQTMRRAADFVRLCESLGVDRVLLLNLLYFGIPGYGESMCLHEDDPEVQQFIQDLSREPFRIPVLLPKLYKREYKPPTCTMPFGLMIIDGEGFIGPCCVKGTDRRWGNVFDTPGIWNGPTMLQARRALLDPTGPLPVDCMHCEEMIQERRCVGGKE